MTVAVFDIKPQSLWRLRDADIEVFTTKDSGPGGQHRNKTESCVVMRHRPTGTEAKASTRSQHQNRQLAREVLEARVGALYAAQGQEQLDRDRRQMVGSGQRADKIRTYRTQDNQVSDHRAGRKARLSDVLRGDLSGLGTQ